MKRHAEALIKAARALSAARGETEQGTGECQYKAGKWKHERRQADEAAGRCQDDEGNTRGMTGRRCKCEFDVPDDKAQENFTDPESRIMNTHEGYRQCYNGQAAVDERSQLMVAAELTNNAADNGQLLPLLNQVEADPERKPDMTLADTGYGSKSTLRELEQRGLAACMVLGREDKTQRAVDADCYPATARMAQWLASEDGKTHFRRRKAIPEPVFGWIKQAMGFRRFSLHCSR